MKARTIEEYIVSLPGWRGEVVAETDRLIRSAAPEATAAIDAYPGIEPYPVYAQDGPFAYMKTFDAVVYFGFWRGAGLSDPDGCLRRNTTIEGDPFRHVRIESPGDIDPERFTDWVKEAVALNSRWGDPTRSS